MKKLLIILSVCFIGLNAFSQANCASAAPFCAGGNSGVNFPAGTTGAAQTGPNYGCLGSQPAPAWYYLQVSTSGNLILGIAGTGGGDVDFICWGPFASLSNICSNLTASNTVDCSYSSSPT